MPNSINIEKAKLFTQLYYSFEDDLKTIFKYTAPTKDNLNTYGDKIHNLLLTIGSECQNLSKEVAYNIANTEGDDFQNIASGSCYIVYLDGKMSLKNKAIQFISGIESGNQIYIKPFEEVEDNEGNIIWRWWSHYNKLKHDKLVRYNKCNLKDVIYALGTYFLLLQYLILGYNSKRNCGTGQILGSKKDIGFDSKMFSSTFCYHERSVALDINGYKGIINNELKEVINQVLQESEEVIVTHQNINKKNCLYYVYTDIQETVTPETFREFRERNLPEVPKITYLQPVFVFTNNKFNQ